MNGFVDLAFGPLAGLECRRSLGRRWMRVGQVLAGLPGIVVALSVLWFWWFQRQIDARYMPGGLLLGGVLVLEWIMLVVALVMSPAVVAGTLAGEKARGVLPLLLASSVSTREIATGRLAGRLTLVAIFLLANLPAMWLMAGFSSLPIRVLLVLFALPAAVSFGVGGMSLLTSAMSRRARDALIAVYLLELLLFLLLLFLVPALLWRFLPPTGWDALRAMNPFYGLSSLIESSDVRLATLSCAFWSCLGLLGLGTASWQLRRVYLRQVDGNRTRSERRHRARPEVGENPMLWKETHFERVEAFSRFVWWVGVFIFLALLGTTLVLAGVIMWTEWVRPDTVWNQWATAELEVLAGTTALPLSWLIQWTIALRAAVAIASEREHGTWDTLLLSDLEGSEIVGAKIWGSLYSLRGFIAAAAVLWTLAALFGAMPLSDYWTRLANTIVISVFMTAAGVWLSLSSSTATRAMTLTIGTWLLSAGIFATLAAMFVLVIMMIIIMAWLYWMGMTQGVWVTGIRGSGPPFPMSFMTGWTLTRLTMYAATAALIALYCRKRFDRLAGRAP